MSNIKKIYASTVAKLDSNVASGGGTDDTEVLQAVLDTALTEGGVHLIMDGAALVSTLRVHSNTTIECLSLECGFFQKADSNTGIISNFCDDVKDIVYNRPLKNVTLQGGTYNQNCANQAHHVEIEPGSQAYDFYSGDWLHWHHVFGLEFYGVENLTIRDLHIRDFSTFACLIGGFKNVLIENVWLDLPGRIQAHNQDGFHFWGPGQYLTVRNVGGRVGDDFMNLGPDEVDYESSITDVLVDGVFHDDADQSIRMLSRGSGSLDHVTVRNITGSYRSFGFYINSWFPDKTAGNFGDIFIENVNLTHTEPNYDYRPPMLFSVGGDIRCLTLKNIRHEYPIDNRVIGEFGLPFYATTPLTIDTYEYPNGKGHKIQNLIIEGVTVIENDQSENMDKFAVYGDIGNMIVRDVLSVKDAGTKRSGNIINVHHTGHVDTLVVSDVVSKGNADVVSGKEFVDDMIQINVVEK